MIELLLLGSLDLKGSEGKSPELQPRVDAARRAIEALSPDK